MIDLEFMSVTLENFCDYLKLQTVSLAKLGKGLTFIRAFNRVEPSLGSNGGGKSTMWDAMTWCLFGRTIDGRRGTDIRPWADPKAHAFVKIVVWVNDAKRTIERSTTANGLWIDGKVVNQEAIEDLLGLSFMMWSNAIVFGQGQDLFFDRTAGDKLKLLSDAMGLDRWNEHVKAASVRTAIYDDAFKRSTISLESIDAQLREAIADIKDTKAKLNDWDRDHEEKHAASTKGLDKDKADLENLRTELGSYDLAYDGAETELRHANKMLDQARADHSKNLTKYEVATAALQRADNTLMDLKDELNQKTDTCPTCGQSLKGKARDDHDRALRAKIKEAEREADACYRTAVATGKAKNETGEVVRRWETDVATYRKKSDDAIDSRTRMQTRVSELAAIVRVKEDAKSTKAVNPYDAILQQHRDRKDRLETLADEAHALVKLSSAKCASNKFWVNGFKQVRLYLLEEFLNELEVITLNMLPRLGLIGWDVRLSIEKEKASGDVSSGLQVRISKPGMDRLVKWESWSGGEAQRLRMAGALALSEALLRRAGVACDLVVLDEPTQHLSPEGVADLVDSLLEFATDRQVILIDHTARETNRFAHVLTVERTAEGSLVRLD